MRLQSEIHGEITVISLPCGALDAGNAAEFKKDVSPLLGRSDKVIIDLSCVGFMDSAGLGAILSVLKRVSGNKGELRLAGMGKEVRALFELVRMHRILDVYNDREQAIKSFVV
jgi:anti-sigma B factor antagonist